MTPRLVDELSRYLATREEARPGRAGVPDAHGRAARQGQHPQPCRGAGGQAGQPRARGGRACPRSASRSRRTRCGGPTSACCCRAGAEVPYVQAQVGHTRPEGHAGDLRPRAQAPRPQPARTSVRHAHARRDSVHATSEDARPRLAVSRPTGGARTAPDRRLARRIWARNWASRTAHDVPMHEAHTAHNEERPAFAGLPGRWARRVSNLRPLACESRRSVPRI